MIESVTDIIIATAAVIGLVPLGVRSVVEMIKNRRKKKNNDMMMTVLLSVVAANLAPPVLTDMIERAGASIEQAPPWLKALITNAATPGQPTTTAAVPTSNDQQTAPLTPESSPNGSGATPAGAEHLG
jgi:hypothetical protein